ncbi:DUF4194 domain-containing protein [Selenomonas sp.]|uniref:DUF4194 domain-containing protein n=1 Tax=Selenomonas sp. TaxID=2053611 RepID=UPI0025FA8413|nr:DUF4194 domain-containing protein [Selenomonas sp.]
MEETMECHEENFSRAAITLLKGIVSRGKDEALWQVIIHERSALADYFRRIGLVLILDEVDEYAYLRQEENAGLPRLVQRYQLSYPVSMLLVELRKVLGEQDTANGDSCLIISFGEIQRRMEPFLPVAGNEMKFRQSLEHTIGQIIQLGFLQKMKGREDEYEVRPVLRSFVDAQWLSDFNEKLAEYEAHGEKLHRGTETEEDNEGEEGLLGEFVRNE